jgi:hypothetical protein
VAAAPSPVRHASFGVPAAQLHVPESSIDCSAVARSVARVAFASRYLLSCPHMGLPRLSVQPAECLRCMWSSVLLIVVNSDD